MTNTPAHPSSLPRPASKPVPHISTIPQVAASPRIPARRLLRKFLLVLAGIAIGALGVRFFPHKESSRVHDCHWTSLNFFRDTADTRAVTPETFTEELAANYFPITGDPRYGDVLILATPSGEILHSAVFIADEIVFTKNGSTAIYPWMFSTIPDLLMQYSFHALEGQQLTLRYFRSKSL